MWLKIVTASNLRIYPGFSIHPSAHINLIVGKNASGKSTILEAITLLSTGRSFRASDARELFRTGSNFCEVGALVGGVGGTDDEIKIRVSEEGKRFSLNDTNGVRLREIAERCPSILVSPESHYHFRNKSADRRAILDWILFHVKPELRDVWGRFQKAVAQRNHGLRAQKPLSQLNPWTQAIIDTGEIINEYRIWAASELAKHFSQTVKRLVPKVEGLTLRYKTGWVEGLPLEEAINIDKRIDLAQGFTNSGPHRADILIQAGETTEPKLSQGQARLSYIALRIAQTRVLFESQQKPCALLLDDITSEIDQDGVQLVVQEASSMPSQIFLTTTNPALGHVTPNQDFKVFHVEQGQISE